MLDEYIKQNHSELIKMSKTITSSKYPDHEELLQETIVYIYESDRNKIETLIKKNQLRYWIARIMMNQYNSSSSRFHYRYRKPSERIKAATQSIVEWHELDNSKEDKEIMLEMLENQLKNIPFFDRFITTIYYKEGHSLNSLSAATGISRTTIYKAIRKTRHELKEKSRTW